MACSRYFRVVEPTWQTRAGGSASSSRYIVYAEVPGGVVSCHGSSLCLQASTTPFFGGGDRCLEVREARFPAGLVRSRDASARGPAVPSRDARSRCGFPPCPWRANWISTSVASAAVAPQVPEVGQPLRRAPHGDLPPVVLGPLGRALVDPAADPALEHDVEIGSTAHRVIPPATTCRSPRSIPRKRARPGTPR